MRPVLVGMNNPLSEKPEHALYPMPSGATGHRIWQMLHERTGASRAAYLRAFDRRNVLDSRTWNREAARSAGLTMWLSLEGRTVVLLGREVLRAMGLGQTAPLEWHLDTQRWCYMPHPSGLNHWYNDPVNWAAASLRLEQLYEESALCAT